MSAEEFLRMTSFCSMRGDNQLLVSLAAADEAVKMTRFEERERAIRIFRDTFKNVQMAHRLLNDFEKLIRLNDHG